MATVKYMAPVRSMSGKIEKQLKVNVLSMNSKFSDRTLFTSYHVNKNESHSPDQIANRTLFKQAHQAAVLAIGDPSTRTPLEQAFQAQSKYKTLLGYAFHIEYARLKNA